MSQQVKRHSSAVRGCGGKQGAPLRGQRLGFALAVLAGLGGAVLLMWSRLSAPRSEPGDGRPPPAVERSAERASEPDNDATPAEAAPSGAAAGNTAAPSGAAVFPASATLCPRGMVYVEGSYCPFVAHRCASYLGSSPEPEADHDDPDEERRCGSYRDEVMCEGRPQRLSFCIDRMEYPDMAGIKPALMVDYRQAARACQADGKRLCEAEEWVFACEGVRTWPYPYGLERDPGACNIDRVPLTPNLEALREPYDVSLEVERLDQRAPSGALPGCVSPFGVADMTGNVSEWVHDREGGVRTPPREGALAGGYWGRVPATCRRLDTAGRAEQTAYHAGFRCCRDALDGRKARRLAPAGSKLPKRRRLRE